MRLSILGFAVAYLAARSGCSIRVAALMMAAVCAGCATSGGTRGVDGDEPSVDELVAGGYRVLTADGFPKRAVEEYFDPAIDKCEALRESSPAKLYVARSQAEMLVYLVSSAIRDEASETIISSCPDAYYLKGYALLDLGRPDEAEMFVIKALEWSPENSMYLSELGHIRQLNGDWPGAITYFEKARKAAETCSPEELKVVELTRAIRGVGFSLIEQGKLDEAEKQFKESLAIDPNDQQSKEEIRYIEELRLNGV